MDPDFDFGNNACHAICPQWNTRRFIARYLEKNMHLMPSGQEGIREAVKHYRDADTAWITFDELLGQRHSDTYGDKFGDPWLNAECRKGASQAVYAAMAHEQAAVDSLRETIDIDSA